MGSLPLRFLDQIERPATLHVKLPMTPTTLGTLDHLADLGVPAKE
jgi:hypothetical protein